MPDSSLIIRIGADTTDLAKGAAEAKTIVVKLAGETAVAANAMVELAQKAIQAGKALADVLLGSALDNIDAQAKLARNVGGTIDGLRALQLYAKDAGISEEGLTSATAKLNQTIGQGLAGNEKAVGALKALKLTAEGLQGLDADAKMATLADAIRAAGLSTEQTLAALKELGIKGGTELVDAMRNGGDAIRSATKEVKDFGLSLSSIDAAKVEAANDAVDRMGLVVEAVQTRIAVELSPLIKKLADQWNNATKETEGFKDTVSSTVDNVVSAVGFVADAWRAVQVVASAVWVVFTAVGSAVMEIVNAVVQLGATIYDAVSVPLNGWIEIANLFGANMATISNAVGGQFAMGMKDATDAVTANVTTAYNNMRDLAAQPMPSTALQQWVADARAASAEAAIAMDASLPGNQAAIDKTIIGLDTMRSLRMLETGDIGAEQQIQLEQANQFQAALTATEAMGVAARQKLSEQIKRSNISDMNQMTGQVLAQYSQHSKKMFEANKAYGIGQALVNTFIGVSTSLSSYPMPVAAVMAALHLASGLATVNSIKSQQFGGSGGGGGAGASAGAAAAASAAETPKAPAAGNTLMVQGIDNDQLFSGSMVRNLAERLSQHTADGGKLVIM